MSIDAHLKLYLQESGKATVRGESSDNWFKTQVGLSDFSFGDTDGEGDEWLSTTGTGSAASKTFAPFGFKVTKELDITSPHLFKAYAVTFSKRKVLAVNFFPQADVVFRKVGTDTPQVYLVMAFEAVLLTTYSLDVDEDGEAKETVGFRFQKVAIEYHPQVESGRLAAAPEMKGWNFEENKVWNYDPSKRQ